MREVVVSGDSRYSSEPFCSLPVMFVYRALLGQWEAVQLGDDHLTNDELLSDEFGGSKQEFISSNASASTRYPYVANHPEADHSCCADMVKCATAALGFLLIAWPFVHDLVFDLFKLVQSLTPGRSKY